MGYFKNNKRRMDYFEFRKEGHLIGSGMVESGAKQFQGLFYWFRYPLEAQWH